MNHQQFGKTRVQMKIDFITHARVCMNCRFSTLYTFNDYLWHGCEKHRAIIDSLYQCELFEPKEENEE